MPNFFSRYNPTKLSIVLIAILSCAADSWSQTAFSGLESLFTDPKIYASRFVAVPPSIDGDITDTVWQAAPWTDRFQDIEGDKKPAPAHDTRVKMLWDRSNLYIAAELREPHVWANLTKHDEIIYYDNDFEVFLDPDNNTHQYFEIEVNALNTVLDLFIPKPYRDGGAVLMSWNAPGLRSKVKINGTLNNPSDTDRSWTVEMAIPFKAVSMGNHERIPANGDLWRINFSRVQWETEIKDGKYVKKKDNKGNTLAENNWVWSPQGVINMHFPERWGYLKFVKEQETGKSLSLELPGSEKLKSHLWLVYYRQKEFQRKNKHYASSLEELGIKPDIAGQENSARLEMESTAKQFRATIRLGNNHSISINHEGLIQQL
jgi:hypothetical protein